VLDRAVAHTLTFVTVAPGCQSEISPKCPESLALYYSGLIDLILKPVPIRRDAAVRTATNRQRIRWKPQEQ
jgi:hypothetical protein